MALSKKIVKRFKEINSLKEPAYSNSKLIKFYHEAIKSSCELLSSKEAYIYLLAEDEKSIDCVDYVRSDKKQITVKSLSARDSVAKWILKLKHPEIVSENSSFVLYTPPMLAAPIILNGVCEGALLVREKKGGVLYDKKDLLVIKLIVSQLMVNLNNLRLKETLMKRTNELSKTEEKYYALYERSNIALLWVDTNGRIVETNKTALLMLGYTDTELTGLNIMKVIKNGAYDYKKLGDLRKAYDETTLIRKDKSLIDAEVSLNKVSLDKKDYYVISAREISEKKKLERQILESHIKFLTIIDGIKEGILLLDKNLNILAINKAQAKRSNITPKEAIGKNCHEILYHQNDVCSLSECSIKKAIKNKKVCKNLFTLSNGVEGDEECTEITAYPLFDAKGGINQVVAVLRDVTKERKLYNQLIYSEKLATLGTLSAKIGHEIRNPLTAVLTCAQFLAIKDIDNKSIKIIISEASRIQSMVNDLLTICKPKEPSETVVFVEKVLDDVIDFLRNVTGQIKFHKIEKIFSEIPPVKGDEEQIRQLFTNLVLNASQAMEEADKREGKLIIKTELSEDERYTVTSIADCGKGIPKEDKKRIFDPFYTTKGAEGTGLGMAVVKEIVDSHEGKIRIKDNSPSGTVVIVYLPITEKGA